MGGFEELPDESGACPRCGKVATTKCTGCKQVCRVPLTNEMHLCAIMKSGASRCTTATVAARKPTGSFISRSARLCPTRSGPRQSSATSWLPTRTSSRERYLEGRCTFNFYYFFLQLILHEAPLVIGPSQMTIPVCLLCYNPVDGSYK